MGRAADVVIPDEQLELVLSIEGYLDRDDIELLYSLGARVPADTCIVEIGSYHGRSTVALALAARAGHGAAVYAVEPHEPFVGHLGGTFGPCDRPHFFTNLLRAGVAEDVRLVAVSSEVITLASGKPAVVQHTGPTEFLPDNQGLWRFRTADEAARALDAVAGDYARQCRLAREIAEEQFDARKVVAHVLERALV
jgi:hypothetical protein